MTSARRPRPTRAGAGADVGSDVGSDAGADVGSEIEVVASALVPGGEALVRRPGRPVLFVPGLLAGETAVVRVTSSKRDFARAVVVAVLEPSADRVVAPCPAVVAGCGGCGWQHLAVAAQLPTKRALVTDALRRQGGVADAEARVTLGTALAPHGYRTTVRAGVDGSGRAGFRRAGGHDVVAADSCLVAHPSLAAVLAGARFRGASEVTMRTSVATGDVVVRADRVDGKPATITDLASAGDIRQVVGDDLGTLRERVDGVDLSVSLGSFFQSSPAAATALVVAVDRFVDGAADTLVDLYGGIGLFAATVGRRFASVVVVEEHPGAVADARHNLAGRTAAAVVAADVERWRPPNGWRGPVTVVADPARSGLGRNGVATVVACSPDVLVLVSCDAAALGRDAALLRTAGYSLTESVVFDVFPHTPHVEVVTQFRREPVTRGSSDAGR